MSTITRMPSICVHLSVGRAPVLERYLCSKLLSYRDNANWFLPPFTGLPLIHGRRQIFYYRLSWYGAMTPPAGYTGPVSPQIPIIGDRACTYWYLSTDFYNAGLSRAQPPTTVLDLWLCGITKTHDGAPKAWVCEEEEKEEEGGTEEISDWEK